MAKQFTGSWAMRPGLLLMACCGFGTFYFMVVLAGSRALHGENFPATLLFASVPFGLFGLVLGLLCLYGILLSFTVYTVDDEKIEARGPLRSGTVYWNQVTDLKTSSSTITLQCSTHQTLRIETSLIQDPRRELTGIIKSRLADLTERMLHELGRQAKTYRPMRGYTILFAIVTLFFWGFVVGFLLDPSKIQGGPGEKIVFVALLGGMGLLMALMALYAYTLQLIVTPDALITRSPFRTHRVSLNRITSIMTRTVSTKSGKTTLTTVEDGGDKITISDNMPDYALVRQYIERKAGVEAVESGQTAAPSIERKQNRQALIAISVISIIGLGGLGFWFLTDAQAQIAKYDLMDRAGAHTTGVITGWYTSGSKSRSYILEYRFVLNGHEYRHASPVTREQYYATHRGDRTGVIYVPSDPDTCRMTISIGREKAEGKRQLSYFMFAFGLVTPVILWLSMLGKGAPRTAA